MAATVIDALRRFLPAHVREHLHTMGEARRRAVWAITYCRTAVMGGHLHACGSCGTREFHFHSCYHRTCPQCGKDATAQWIEGQFGKRVGAPYFMVTFNLPEELRPLFFTQIPRSLCLPHRDWRLSRRFGWRHPCELPLERPRQRRCPAH